MTFLPDNSEGEEMLRDILTPEGRVIREILIPNPYTGEVHRIAMISDVRYNPATDRPESVTQEIMPVGIDGTPLNNIQDFSICGKCCQPVSKTHSVIDPFCGRVLCLMHSQMIDYEGVILRVCADCANAIKKARRWQAVKNFFLGRG